MEKIEKRIFQLENDRDCLMKFKSDMIETFRTREPSKETYKFIGEMNIGMALNSKEHQEIKEGMKNIETKLDTFINKVPAKEASWAEGVLKMIGYIIMTIIVGAFMFLIIKDNLH